jgi:CheY-like chemotaxis protein
MALEVIGAAFTGGLLALGGRRVLERLRRARARDPRDLARELTAPLAQLERVLEAARLGIRSGSPGLAEVELERGVALARDVLALAAAPTPAAALERAPERSVLVVEDDRDSRTALVLLLEDIGYAVAEAGSCDEAIERVLASSPSLAILDVGLPGRDGLATREALRALDPGLAILFLTGDAARVASIAGDERTAVLSKPVDATELEEVASGLLDRRTSDRASAGAAQARSPSWTAAPQARSS